MVAIIGGETRRFRPLVDLYREMGRRAGHAPEKLKVGVHALGYVADTTEEAVEDFFPGYAKAFTEVGKERGWPAVTRAHFNALLGPHGALLVGNPEEVAEKILAHSEALGGISRISFQMDVAALPHAKLMRAIERIGTAVAPNVAGKSDSLTSARNEGKKMTETSQFLVDHGLAFVIAAVFAEQMGLPIPAVPWLLAAGALAADGKCSVIMCIGMTVLACVFADTFWFYLGRWRGAQVLGWLCLISLEPDSCIRRTQNLFTRYGLRGLLAAKFVPGFGGVARPLAGMAGISTSQFILVDAIGSLAYGLCGIGFGFLFSSQIRQIGAAITSPRKQCHGF